MSKTQSKETKQLQSRRIFSEALKKKVVQDFERNLFTVIQLSRIHSVSQNSIYKWIRKYAQQAPNTVQVVQMKSEEHRTLLLQEEVKELQRLLGQQQVLVDLQERVLDHVSGELGYDVKKKYAPLFSKNSGKILKD